jgi:hypothetical protein
MREPTQLVTLVRPFRGVTRTIVMKPGGQVIIPARRLHGLATWHLEPGKYIIATIHKPRRLRVFEVTIQCLEIGIGVRRVLSESSFITTRIARSTITGLARGVCQW